MKKLMFIFLFIVFLPSKSVGELPLPLIKKMMPAMCMPIEIFEKGQKNVGEKQILFGILKYAPDILFEIYKNSTGKPSFTATIRKGNEICVIVAGGELIPTWWFEESCLAD